MRRVTHILPLLLVLAILLWPPLTLSQTDSAIQTGKVIESVVIKNHTDQSYAVFLPSNYTTEKSWPTVFCLDPRGRGKVAIDRFVSAAEKYGYVVFCSNNSRNGLNWSTIGDIFSNFWDDAHARFNIDEKRTYAAGFSGGSRLASTFASRCRGCLAGVIGSGAGYPGDILPDAKTPFAYFGIIGVDDFNFGEMWQLEKKLSKLEAPYHFENFSGGHEWAPKENIDNALAWFILQAMKSGTTPERGPAMGESSSASTTIKVSRCASISQHKASRPCVLIGDDRPLSSETWTPTSCSFGCLTMTLRTSGCL